MKNYQSGVYKLFLELFNHRPLGGLKGYSQHLVTQNNIAYPLPDLFGFFQKPSNKIFYKKPFPINTKVIKLSFGVYTLQLE